MDYINTYYTRNAYEEASVTEPSISFIIETGEVIYDNQQVFTFDFNDDFDLLDFAKYEEKFNFYKEVG